MKNIMAIGMTPVESLQYAQEDIADTLSNLYKGLGSNITSFTASLRSYLPDVRSFISSTSNGLDSEQVTKLSRDQRKFIELVSKYPFSEVREIRAFRPEQLNCTYLELVDLLDKEIEHCKTIQKEILNPYMVLLGQLLSNDKFSTTSLDTNNSTYKKISSRRETAIKAFNKLYKPTNLAICTVKDVIDRNEDWKKIFDKVNSLADSAGKLDRKQIQKDIDHCCELIDSLIEKNNTGEMPEITGEVLNNVINGTLEAAKEVEYLSVTYYRLLSLKGSVENTMEQIEKVYK